MSYILSNFIKRSNFLYCPLCGVEVIPHQNGWPDLKCPSCYTNYYFGLEPDPG